VRWLVHRGLTLAALKGRIRRQERDGRPWTEDPRILIPLAVGLLVWPLLGASNYWVNVAVVVLSYVVLGLGLNIVVGFAGLLDLGYVAFYAVGAYIGAILITQFGWNIWLCIPVAGITAALFGVLIGAPTLRLRGDYLAIVTIGFGEITRITINNLTGLTGGPNGVFGIPKPQILGVSFTEPIYFYYLLLALAGVAVLLSQRLLFSRIGRAWTYLREDELAARVMGVNAARFKLMAFAFGAFWAGIAGAIFSSRIGIAAPESFTFLESILIVVIVVIGGMGSIPGVIAGATAMILIPEILRPLLTYRFLIFGIVLILVMRFRPEGLIPGRRLRAKKPTEDVLAEVVPT
jgi:branched-chain amino acid transport system permease protein